MRTQDRRRSEKASVQLWVPPDLRERFKRVVAQEERTVAQDLRRYMSERVAAHDAEDEREAA